MDKVAARYPTLAVGMPVLLPVNSQCLSLVGSALWLTYGLMISAQNFVTVPVFIYMTLKAAIWRADNPNYVSASA